MFFLFLIFSCYYCSVDTKWHSTFSDHQFSGKNLDSGMVFSANWVPEKSHKKWNFAANYKFYSISSREKVLINLKKLNCTLDTPMSHRHSVKRENNRLYYNFNCTLGFPLEMSCHSLVHLNTKFYHETKVS